MGLETSRAIPIQRTYLEKDYLQYEKDLASNKKKAEDMGLHPDVLVMAGRGYVRVYKKANGCHTFAVKASFMESGEQLKCPYDQHVQFLKEYEKWKSAKDVRVEAENKNYQAVVIPDKKFETQVETPEEFGELLDNWDNNGNGIT